MPHSSWVLSISLAVLVLAVGPTAADTAGVDTPTVNTFISPSNDESLPQGKPVTIRWTPTTPGPVKLLLCFKPHVITAQPEILYPLAEDLANTGSYTWYPSVDLATGLVHYQLKLVDEGTGQIQYSKSFLLHSPETLDRRTDLSPDLTPAPPASEAPPLPVSGLQPRTNVSSAPASAQAAQAPR